MGEPSAEAISEALAKSRAANLGVGDFADVIRNPLPTGVNPWELWALVAFRRHERRQRWVGYVVETKLGDSLNQLGAYGALGHPEEVPHSGPVPDEPEWKYFFHGRGCCLTHLDGTSIDVDFGDNGESNEIDPYFYSAFLRSAKTLSWSEARLQRAVPLDQAWQLEIEELRGRGLLRSNWRFQLTAEGTALAERLEPVIERIDVLATNPSAGARRSMAWLLCAVGDAVAAADAISADADVAALVRAAAAQQVATRESELRTGGPRATPFAELRRWEALATLGRSHIENDVERILRDAQPSHLLTFAHELLSFWEDPRAIGQHLALLEALSRAKWWRQLPWPSFFRRRSAETYLRDSVILQAARAVLRTYEPSKMTPKIRKNLRRALTADFSASDSEAALLLYLIDGSSGFRRLKSNLHHAIPFAREQAAIALALLETDPAIDALIEGAARTAEAGSHEAACALVLLENSERAQRAATDWTRRNDGFEEAEAQEIEFAGQVRRTWSVEDLLRVNRRQLISHRAKKMKQDFAPLLMRWSK